MARGLSDKIHGIEMAEPIGPQLRKWISENLETVRFRLAEIISSEPAYESEDGWELWFTDAVDRLQTRELTRLVLVPSDYVDGPKELVEWAKRCTDAHRKIAPPSEVWDWFMENGGMM